MTWKIERTPGSRVRRTEGDRVALPLRLLSDHEPATDAELLLTLVEAEHLHAALCRALDTHPAPPSAPGCRTGVLYGDTYTAGKQGT